MKQQNNISGLVKIKYMKEIDVLKDLYKLISINVLFTFQNFTSKEKVKITTTNSSESNVSSELTVKINFKNVFRLLIKNNNNSITVDDKQRPLYPKDNLVKIIENTFYLISYNKELYFGSIHGSYIYFLNSQDFSIVKVINLKKIKKIGIRKKACVAFLTDDKKQTKYFSLFSSFNRNIFCNDLLSKIQGLGIDSLDQEKIMLEGNIISKREIIFQRQILNKILSNCDNLLSYFLYFIHKFKEDCPKSYYQISILPRILDISKGNLKKKNVLILFFNYNIINSIVKILYFSFKYLPFDLLKDLNYVSLLKTKLNDYRKEALIKSRNDRYLARYSPNENLLKQRTRNISHINRKSKANKKNLNEKIEFKYYRKSDKSSQVKTIIIYSNHFEIMIGNSKTASKLDIIKIDRLNTTNEENDNSFLEIIYNLKIDQSSGTKEQEIYTFYFCSGYERYLFQTIIYNHIISSLKYKTIINNQLTINCNVMTWNLSGIDVPNDLYPLFNSKSLTNVDVLAIGVQECGIFKITDWMRTLKRIMVYYGFVEVISTSMFQMFLTVFVKSEIYSLVDCINQDTKPMGFAKILGNKGGMVISFKLSNFLFSFVNCHLAPKPHKVLERNKHVKMLIESIRVENKISEFDTQSDYLYWMGDMNYRVDYIYDQVLEEISRNNLQFLLSKDQLIRQKEQNHIFTDFQEAEINFWPTYRRIKGTDLYSNKKNQSPSWCDRILIKTERQIEILYYDSIQEVNLSDHLPVLSKSTTYLTIPTYEDLSKLMDQKIQGTFCFSNINLDYSFTEGLSELDEKIVLPVKIKLIIYYFTNQKKSESKSITIKDYNELNIIEFDDIYVSIPPQCLFDLPLAKAMNFIFVLQLIMNGNVYEIGFSKFSLETIEAMNSNLMYFSHEMVVNFRTRRMGRISFDATYKM